MNHLLTITDHDFDPDAPAPDRSKYALREASRAIVFNEKNEIALMDTGQYQAHKLPGGRIEPGESKEAACIRECREETGYDVVIAKELGHIDEYKDKRREHWRSYFYAATTKGVQHALQFTQEEIDAEFRLMWSPLSEAIRLMQQDAPIDYDGRYILKRDRWIVQYYNSL